MPSTGSDVNQMARLPCLALYVPFAIVLSTHYACSGHMVINWRCEYFFPASRVSCKRHVLLCTRTCSTASLEYSGCEKPGATYTNFPSAPLPQRCTAPNLEMVDFLLADSPCIQPFTNARMMARVFSLMYSAASFSIWLAGWLLTSHYYVTSGKFRRPNKRNIGKTIEIIEKYVVTYPHPTMPQPYI